MLENHIYNLMEQIVYESKSLWRIKKAYKQDAGDCAQCLAFWDKLGKIQGEAFVGTCASQRQESIQQ